jgi:hypothetical protein
MASSPITAWRTRAVGFVIVQENKFLRRQMGVSSLRRDTMKNEGSRLASRRNWVDLPILVKVEALN